MYSQYDEEKFILEYFSSQPIGRFLDVGASGGSTFSNTYALTLKGWNGVCVEPSKHNVLMLERLYADNQRVQIVPMALAEANGQVDFYESAIDRIHGMELRLLGTTVPDHVQKWSTGNKVVFEKTTVPAVSPETLLGMCPPGNFDLVSIDTESTSVDLLKLLPLSKMQTKMVVAEHDGRCGEVEAYCWYSGLKRVIYKNGVNMIMVA